jgi:EmrB/QacA subfamily drug resistance transporter
MPQPRVARWVLAASVLGSGAAFLESSVISVVLPAVGRDLRLGMEGLQWIMNTYLLALSALMLLGGALGDRYSRARVFRIGAVGFAIATAACAFAPDARILFGARLLQGASGALLVPNSLAMVEEAYTGEARGAAIGQWAGWSGISTAAGPLVGGWLAEKTSWRSVFIVVIPFALGAALIAWRHVPPLRPARASSRTSVDYAGALLVTLGLAGVVAALTSGPGAGFGQPLIVTALAGGILCLAIFVVVEARSQHPLVPLTLFRNRQFTGTNVTTFLLYAALSGLFFLLMLELQNALHWSPVSAGASLLPVNVLMLLLSPRAGKLAERIGPRIPMTAGALVSGLGMLLFSRVHPGAAYATSVLPASLVFGLGLATFVAPLTASALGSVAPRYTGLASGFNNAVARLAGLLATAAIPLAAGLGGLRDVGGEQLTRGFTRAVFICAVLCASGGAVAWFTVPRRSADRRTGPMTDSSSTDAGA